MRIYAYVEEAEKAHARIEKLEKRVADLETCMGLLLSILQTEPALRVDYLKALGDKLDSRVRQLEERKP